jgi:membrane protein required for colicin V production
MAFFDVVILLLLILFVFKGALRGVVRELFSLAGLLVGVWLAFRFGGGMGAEMARVCRLSPLFCTRLMYVVLFLLGVVGFALIGLLLGRSGKIVEPGGALRVAGALLALLQGVAVLAVALHALALHPVPQSAGPALKRSRLAPPFVELGGATLRGAGRIFGPDGH